MKLVVYLIGVLFAALPGALLIMGSRKIKRNANATSGNFLVFGSVLVTISLISSTGNWFVAGYGTAEDLASFALVNMWIEGGAKYIGLLFIAIGLLLFKSQKNDQD